MEWVDLTLAMDYSFTSSAELTHTVGDSKTNHFLTDSTENRAVSSRRSRLVLWEGVGGGEEHGDGGQELGDGEEGLDGWKERLV